MPKISKKLSVNISIITGCIFMIACVFAAFVMPPVVEMLINLPDNIGERDSITYQGRILVLVLSYLMLAILMVADTLMLTLLFRVKKGLVFSEKSIMCIRGISWCCFLICLVFGVLGIYFQLSFILAFFALFLGISLRVVKNVIEEATEIKSENDLTV